VIGKRHPDGTALSSNDLGGYCRDGDVWVCVTPNGRIGDLSGHEVVEHADGTISVSPSILVYPDEGGWSRPGWHGYLRCGVWSES
jgi:hypothetical protein